MLRCAPLCFLLVLSLLPSCGGGSSSGPDPLEEALPDHQETLKPCTIRIGDECVITITVPVQHPQYEGNILFADDMAQESRLSYSTSSLFYLVSIDNSKQVTMNISEMTPSSDRLATLKYSLRVNMNYTTATQGTATWEIKEGSVNSADHQTRQGEGIFTISEL